MDMLVMEEYEALMVQVAANDGSLKASRNIAMVIELGWDVEIELRWQNNQRLPIQIRIPNMRRR